MDPATHAFYDDHAAELARRYDAAPDGVSGWFAQAFEGRNTVLDVGCGSGRDVRRLVKLGFDARGVDASAAMIDQARAAARAEGVEEDRFTVAALPELKDQADETFDAVLCCAVLMHIPDEHLFDAVYGLRRVLRPGGRLLVSIPERRPDVDPATSRDPLGRLFAPLVPDKLSLLIERIGFRPVWRKTTADSLARPGHAWTTMLFEKLAANADRPLDQVESVLNRDKKDATYKLALFRALAEIAQTQYNTARHTHDHRVKIPLEAIAQKWLAYYWPIVSSETFIAQKFGEREQGGMPIAIRKPLAALIDSFPPGGGWPAFSIALKNNRLTAPQQRQLARAMSVLKSTIWNMPVRHAGGGEFSVFAYDRADQTVILPVDLWRELVLTGSWIQDATVLRWAELTEKLSGGDVPMSLVVEKLLSITDPDRETRDARTLYLSRGVTECVWSGRAIHEKLDVDHAIPFVLWHNNDLWNLFPARPDVNNAKRDLLPAQLVLQKRHDAIIGCWEILHAAFPDRFLREAAGLCGGTIPPGNWQAPLFSRFAEAIEITATQRSVPRWDPNAASRSAARARRASPATTPTPRSQLPASSSPIPAPSSPLPALPYTDIQPHAYTRYLPLTGNLAAGPASAGFDITNLDHATECPWVEVPEALCGKNRYVVRIAGDSMEPELHVGDLVVFEYHRIPRAENQIVVANLPALGITSDSATLDAVKRLIPDPHDWIFRSTNPAYPDLRIPKRECAYPILGVMVNTVEAVDHS
jgi:SAM-dependent methyltransferase/phage repressor protein C with HTH and peptisase S24 domain